MVNGSSNGGPFPLNRWAFGSHRYGQSTTTKTAASFDVAHFGSETLFGLAHIWNRFDALTGIASSLVELANG